MKVIRSLDLLFLRLVDDHLVTLLHVSVELLSKFEVVQQSVVYLDKAIVLVLCFLILPQKLCNVLVSLDVFGFELLKPFLSLFDTDRFHLAKAILALFLQMKILILISGKLFIWIKKILKCYIPKSP
jgi:hypothetical protein